MTSNPTTLANSTFDTPLGQMTTITSEQTLYFLAFTDQPSLSLFYKKMDIKIISGKTAISASIQKNIWDYFHKTKITTNTPLIFTGTDFQNAVWKTLQNIPFGMAYTYETIAKLMNKPNSTRAVANAIGQNPFSIIIPCHRVIRKDGSLGGYNGGTDRKKWLLEHEIQADK